MSKRSNEKIFDLVLSDALVDMWEIKLTEYDSMQIEKHKFPDEFERKIMKIKNSIGRKERIHNSFRFTRKILAVIAILLGIIFVVLLTQPTVYAAVKSVVITIFDKFDRYDFVSNGNNLSIEDFDDKKRLEYVPEGYILFMGYYSPTYVMLIYTNEENEIQFTYGYKDGMVITIDNEHNDFKHYIINETEYFFYESHDDSFPNTIIWSSADYTYKINAQVSFEEFVKIAKNVK